jgi:type II secretory pathway component GspD/PulD (secretin)
MKRFSLRSQKSLISSVALWTFLSFLGSDVCYTQSADAPILAVAGSAVDIGDEPKYTVNFNHVPITEVIRFVSKITHTNFVFEETDLQFSVTIISEEPLSVKNIMSALIQVLRVHDLRLLEQENNLMITKSAAVNQISTLVSADQPPLTKVDAPIVTRVFRIKNATPSSVAAIIRPMVSASSQIEVSMETRQLIVTDITTNVDKIAALLVSLDTPHNRLEIESYVVKHISPSDIIALTQQILSAFVEGNPLILVPQTETNSVFIVSTPYLIERALTVMEDLDVPPTNRIIGPSGAEGQELHVYRIENKMPVDLLANLKEVSDQLLAANPGVSTPLLESLQGVKYISDTNSLVFIANAPSWTKIQEILKGLDASPYAGPLGANSFWVYKIQKSSFPQIESALQLTAETVHDRNFLQAIHSMKWVKENNSIVFNAPETVLKKIKEVVPTFDVEPGVSGQKYYLFKVEKTSEATIRSALDKIAASVQDKNLSDTIASARWIKENNTLLFSGPESSILELQQIVPTLDVVSMGIDQKPYLYQIQNASAPQIIAALKEMSGNLHDKALTQSIDHVRWIEENNSLLFNGSVDTIARLQSILPTLDIGSSVATKSHFLIYNPIHQKGETLEIDVKHLADKLKKSGLANYDLLNTLNSVTWTASTNTLLFTGDPASLERVQTILTDLDSDLGNNAPVQVLLYKPQYLSHEQLQTALNLFAHNLGTKSLSDQQLSQAIQSAHWIDESASFLFKADDATLTRLKGVLDSLDNEKASEGAHSHGFYLYKLQIAPGNVVIQNLKGLADNISASDSKNAGVIKAIHGLKWVKENNAILITGSASVVEQVKTLIAEFDVPASEQVAISAKTEFFIYKPSIQTPEHIQTSLEEFAKDLEHSGLSDPDFLHTLRAARYVPATKSILFTGTAESLAKTKNLLVTLDSGSAHPTPIQTIGGSTFLIYKIQNAGSSELVNSLHSFAKQLSESPGYDKNLATALDSVKWIKETNSLLFTGSEDTLKKVEPLVEKFDLSSLKPAVRESASAFVIYSPKYQSGESLIGILNEFMENLVHSGVSDPSLFDTIKHLKFIPKTNSLIISGSDSSIARIQDLLLKFDVPTEGSAAPMISTIDATNFLIYKLQYHKGQEIQGALKKVALSLQKGENPSNKALIECIDSLQWIEVTNSLLGTGQPDILEKVKGLIQNLDVPLRQVFIEILVIETTVNNGQSFGLQWGSQLQYLNKTIGTMGNFPPATNGANVLQTPLTNTTATTPPVQGGTSTNSVPFLANSFDLGIIGDIIFHKGQSFVSLGSLLNALQTDADTTIVMNPKIMTQDGHTSNIFVGQNVPFVGSFVSNTSSNTTETSNIEYRDVGFNLIVTPTLGTNNVITLDINQDVSSQIPTTLSLNNTVVSGITTNHATMTTRVHVPDRHFLVLSGMIQDEKTHTKQGVPCLGGLPMIGALFTQNAITDAKNNVIIFLKPYIVHSFEDYDKLTDGEVILFKDQAVLPEIKEAIDSSREMVENIENN